VAALPDILEQPFFSKRVHALPEALMPVSGQLFVTRHLLECVRLEAAPVIGKVTEDAGFKYEISSVDPPLPYLGLFGKLRDKSAN
jgi:hypothetical protein